MITAISAQYLSVVMSVSVSTGNHDSLYLNDVIISNNLLNTGITIKFWLLGYEASKSYEVLILISEMGIPFSYY